MQIKQQAFRGTMLQIEAIEEAIPPMLRLALRLALASLPLASPAMAATAAEQRGKSYAQSHCARCHSIDRVTKSPVKSAPPLRTLHLRYPIETLAEALAEGISTGHPAMQPAELDPDQIHTPGIFVTRIIDGSPYKKLVEKRTVRTRKEGAHAVVA